jgi:hypothetical protein
MGYECVACGFKSDKPSEYARHISTKKHNSRCNNATLMTMAAVNVPSLSISAYCCKFCNKSYSARNSAWYHEKKCGMYREQLQQLKQQQQQQLQQQQVKDEMIDNLLKDNAEMMKLIKEIVPRIGNTMIMQTNHNKFNINVFLNEQCKDAVNISDFVDSLKITMQDLHLTEECSLLESITHVLVKGLNNMDVYKRPIHCTDLKRDTMYVKDNEVWERDETSDHLRKSVNDIAFKQIVSVQNWMNALPDIHCDEQLQLKYNTLLLKTLADTGEKDVRKIVKSVCKHVYISNDMFMIQ